MGPVRMCIGCRSRAPRSSLLRVVAHNDSVAADAAAVLPGRGAWLHPSFECLRLAERKRAFPRALKVAGPLETGSLHVLMERAGEHDTQRKNRLNG